MKIQSILWLSLGFFLLTLPRNTFAQEFRFPAQVRTGTHPSYTAEALEALQKKQTGDRSIPEYTDAEYTQRIKEISDEIPMRYNALVKAHVKSYTARRRSATETIISRSMVYFPIFEEAFQRHRIPTELKYLAIVESALNPNAVSPVGAVGLWQFMKPTAQHYKLRVNRAVDERRDPHAASNAAALYLTDLYERYHDWNMAIAAYNCGPGRVNKAVQDAGKSNYWEIQNHLPRETRNYVPAFIGVAYAMNYYHLHNIYPEHPEYDLQVTDKILVFDKIALREIAKITGLTVEAVQFLNPAYSEGYIPQSTNGYILTLPLTAMADFRAAVPNTAPVAFDGISTFASGSLDDFQEQATEPIAMAAAMPNSLRYIQNQVSYRVKKGDNLGKIAKNFNCTVSDIRSWNNLKSSLLHVGQELVIVETKVQDSFVLSGENVVKSPTTPTSTTPVINAPSVAKTEETTTFYKVERGETLWSVALKNGVTVQALMQANQLKPNQKIQPGMQLVIPKK